MATEDRGFASMDRNTQREIASKGGMAAHQKGTAHKWTSEEAREAVRKGPYGGEPPTAAGGAARTRVAPEGQAAEQMNADIMPKPESDYDDPRNLAKNSARRRAPAPLP